MIRIKKVTFKNYRMYRENTIIFPENKNCSIFVCRNGGGKTTFVKGVLWCLYGKEYYNNDTKTEPIINQSVFNSLLNKMRSAQPDSDNKKFTETVQVKIEIEDDIKKETIEFAREREFYPTEYMDGYKSAGKPAKLKITITPRGENPQTYNDDNETKKIVEKYFNEKIYGYYFFDGEKLSSYFEDSKSEDVKNAILNISQVTLLANTIDRLKRYRSKKEKECKKKDSIKSNINDEIAEKEDAIKKYESALKQDEKEYEDAKKKYNEAENWLKDNETIKRDLEDRDNLEKKRNELKEKKENFEKEKTKFILDYLLNLKMYSRMNNTLRLINEKEKKGELNFNQIDFKILEDIIQNHYSKCPVCNSKIDKDCISYIKNEIKERKKINAISSETIKLLSEIKSPLETKIEECEKYDAEYGQKKREEKEIDESIKENDEKLQKIHEYLTNNSNNADIWNAIKEKEKARKENLMKMGGLKEQIEEQRKKIDEHKKCLKELENKRSEEELIVDENKKIENEAIVYRYLYECFEKIKEEIINETRKKIEESTQKHFTTMLCKEDAGKVKFNDDYSLSVNKDYGKSMEGIGSLSETEKMALAFAFVFAILDSSGKNSPLIVDSPLGRSSDENRKKIMIELLNAAKNRQIIMFFTPDEHDNKIKEICQNSEIVYCRKIHFSEGQSEVGRIEELYG